MRCTSFMLCFFDSSNTDSPVQSCCIDQVIWIVPLTAWASSQFTSTKASLTKMRKRTEQNRLKMIESSHNEKARISTCDGPSDLYNTLYCICSVEVNHYFFQLTRPNCDLRNSDSETKLLNIKKFANFVCESIFWFAKTISRLEMYEVLRIKQIKQFIFAKFHLINHDL